MRIDYEKIREDNINKYGTEIHEYGPVLLQNLYSDQTHFIYELLQNAEDAQATEVQFRLYSDRLEVEHDGRPFNAADVRGICGLVLGTKRDDLTKIGKFGIGFKSVYTHTASPEIHSCEEHFAIDNYVHPRSIDPRATQLGTLFVFPFRIPKKSHQAIASRLQALGSRTLLFLRNLNEITFILDGDRTGSYRSQTDTEYEKDFVKSVAVTGEYSGKETKENWLVFEKNVAHLDENLELVDAKMFAVQIAFLVSDYDSNGCPIIETLSRSCLNVFFPTERETELGFLVQGPYRTNSARDDIPIDDELNIMLAEETAGLVVDSLRWLRDREWLTVDVLETMPLADVRRSYYSTVEHNRYKNTLFEPIYETVKQAMTNEALIPAYNGGYVSAQNARLAGSTELRNLMDSTQLQQLLNFDNHTQWITEEITERRTRELWRHLTTILDVEEIDAEKFVRRLDRDFMSQQSDDWILSFYKFASKGSDNMLTILRSKPIIRLVDGKHVSPFNSGSLQAYLPTEYESGFPTVKPELCNTSEAKAFLKSLGIKKPDIVDEIKRYVLPKYNNEQEIDDEQHQRDITLITKALGVDSQNRKNVLMQALRKTPFLLASSIGGKAYREPGQIYFRSQELEMYFEGNPDCWFLSEEYEYEKNIGKDNLRTLGIKPEVEMNSTASSYSSSYGRIPIYSYHGNHARALNGFDPRWQIDGLKFALSHPSIARSSYIWNKLLLPNQCLISGRIERSTRQDYSNGRIYEETSLAGTLVRSMAWLPDGKGKFAKPSDLWPDDLPDEFQADETLANQLGMRIRRRMTTLTELSKLKDIADDDKKILAIVDGRSPEEVKEAFKILDEKKKKEREAVVQLDPEDYSAELEDSFNRPGRPKASIPQNDDPTKDTSDDKRINAELEIGDGQSAKRHESKIKRSWVSKNPKTRKFLQREYDGHCQICYDDLLFFKRDQNPYFEAVHIIPRTQAEWLDHPRNALCLCAQHAAQWQHGERSTSDSDILEQIRSSGESRPHDIIVVLCGEPQIIRFSADHIFELKTSLEVAENL